MTVLGFASVSRSYVDVAGWIGVLHRGYVLGACNGVQILTAWMTAWQRGLPA